ncbi:putative homeodomain transcription factor 2 isoform X2 [Acanthaster planci]|uniref:Homeodomain transcription factor 2 isoform X2 n=1 Tax=Acanthaster planci TaxID=133434 RepID=A0A8B7ZD62_ACAPL|nr:putative homeodomain transcription factor 2 isoform X2 [Acanthaster planci]
MLGFSGINEAISGFQQQIGAYDKELWEEHVEIKELNIQGLPANNIPLRTGRLKTELIDIDLVRGSTFTKAKPEHSLGASARKGLIRVLFFPFYFQWWKQQLSKWMLVCLLVLYFLQALSITVYFLYSPSEAQQPIFFTEVFTPVVLALVLGTVYSLVVCTTVKKSRALRRRMTRRSREVKTKQRKPTSEDSNGSYSKKRGMRRSQSLPCTADTYYQVRQARRNLARRFSRPGIVVEDSTTGRRESLVEGTDEASAEDGLGNDGRQPPEYIRGLQGDETTGYTEEDFTLLGKPIEETDIAGEILLPDLDPKTLGETDTAVACVVPKTAPSAAAEDATGDLATVKGQGLLNTSKPAEESKSYVTQNPGAEVGTVEVSSVSLLERAKKSSITRFSDDVSDNPQHASDSEGPAEDREERGRERGLRSRAGVRKGRRKRQEYGSSNESDLDTRPVRQVRSLEDSHLRGPSRFGDSDMDDPSWGETAEEVSSSGTSSESSESDSSDSENDKNEEIPQFEDPFKLLPATVTSTPSACTNTEKIRVRIFEGDECKKADLSVLEISCYINTKVRNTRSSCDYILLGALCAVTLASIPISFRLRGVSFLDLDLSWLTSACLQRAAHTFRVDAVAYVIVGLCSMERLALSLMFFFLLSVAEKTYKQRCLFAKYFSHLTSTRRARKSGLPHFRLDKVSNIKAWLSLRSFLKKRGPQRSIDIIVSSAFMLTLCMMSVLCVEMLQKEFKFLTHLFNWELIAWTFCMCPFLLRFMTLGSTINQKFRNTSVLLTEQINLYLHMEKKPHKKDDLMLANNVLKLASKLLKEIETPFKIAGMSMNPVLYNITRVVVLSAFSGVLTELLGFKLKLWKIKAT